MGAMLEMMQRMMGKEPGPQKGKQPGQQGNGGGMEGDSSAENTNAQGAPQQSTGKRRVPKSAGNTGSDLPVEFQKALDAYNRPSNP